ncbi:protein tyrosine kinase domain-containing protein [Ditylenchus destructor]|uniref:Protein tyrosine kinase domain-containing protein n=1 Tax=Ditylenchus destructor TaxID=166010 RepID=A0AAD4QWK7_9BILA|nr:protein tyrosine kinase domain-containing protein [Ditylenchus destructor]
MEQHLDPKVPQRHILRRRVRWRSDSRFLLFLYLALTLLAQPYHLCAAHLGVCIVEQIGSGPEVSGFRYELRCNSTGALAEFRSAGLNTSTTIQNRLKLDPLRGQGSQDGTHWDVRSIFPTLPQRILVDRGKYDVTECFKQCRKESATFEAKPSGMALGKPLELRCRFNSRLQVRDSRSSSTSPEDLSPFYWPLRSESHHVLEFFDGNVTSLAAPTVHKKWEVGSGGLAVMSLNETSSDELGFVACRCFGCRTPAFAVAELRFDVNLTATIEDNNGSDSQLVVHGHPVDELTLRVVRLSDNSSERHRLEEDITSFFNDSFLVKYQRDHSYFFLKYYSMYIHECTDCTHSQTDGHYILEVCGQGGRCVEMDKRFGEHYKQYHKVESDDSHRSSSGVFYYVLIFMLVVATFSALAFASALASYKIRRKIMRHGWELKRRRASRNTDRTEETSIPLEDSLSQSASSTYIMQHVPVIESKFIQLKDKIGKGAFGEVYTAEWMQSVDDDGAPKGDHYQRVAVKMLHNVQLDAEMDKEAALLAKLDHPNVLKLYGVCYWHTQVTLVLELMNQGDLKSYLKNRMPRCDNYSQFPPALLQTELVNICTQICNGLCYIASQQIVHRDLAARNCLVSGESDMKFCSAAFRPPFVVKISDFGMSRRLYSDTEYYRMHDKHTALPVRWLPPECLSSGKFTHQSDMWSFGVTLFEVFTYGDVPFGNLSNNEVLTAVVSGLRPEIPPNCPQHIADILKLCWKENPLKRICAEEALTRLKLMQ